MGLQIYLQREDIIGKRIKGIYKSPWDIDPDGFGACSTYIELEDDTAFELLRHPFGSVKPVTRIDLSRLDMSPCREPYLTQCFGETVLEAFASEYWPCMGLLLSNDCFIYERDFPNPDRSGALLIGPIAEPIGEPYSLDDVVPYWDQQGD